MTDDPSISITVPKGLGPGDVPSGITWPRKLWLILPEITSSSQDDSINRIRTKLSNQRRITVSEVRVKNVKGEHGFTYPLIPAKDVAGLYRGAHRARAAVISFCGAKVLLDIGELPSNKGCMALEKFIGSKCSYILISRPEEVDRALAKSLSWMEEIDCDGPHDPRCLPSAIFETNRYSELTTEQGRKRFIDYHASLGRGNSLTDARDRCWQVGPCHTLDLIQVAGCTLPIGFHWDVQASSKSSKIATGWETWRLPGRGYINVHPDAHIRGNKANRTHSLATATSGSKPPRASRSARKKKGQL
jgi:hypothetical protein